jgi:hypothetical protein
MVECKIAFERYNVGQFIGIQIDYPSQECDQLFEKSSMIGNALRTVYEEGCKKTGPERVRLITALGTEFFVSGKVYGVLARSAGSLYARAASELKTVIQNCKKEMTVEQLIACAEGVEVKIAVETDLLMEKSVEKATKPLQGTKANTSTIEIAKKYSREVEEVAKKFGDKFKEIQLPLPDAKFLHHVLDRHFPGGSNIIDKNGLAKSLFNAGEDFVEIAAKGWKYGEFINNRAKIYDVGRVIGKTGAFEYTSKVRIVVDHTGALLTMFPV